MRAFDFYHGTPVPSLVAIVHRAGALASWQVGSVEEARAAVDAGCDLLAVRGVEGGGRMHGNQPLWPLRVVDVFARIILLESSISFLGLGLRAPAASWGLLVADGRAYIRSAWWLITVPGLFIFLTALSINMFGLWLRMVNDPVHRWRYLRSR